MFQRVVCQVHDLNCLVVKLPESVWLEPCWPPAWPRKSRCVWFLSELGCLGNGQTEFPRPDEINAQRDSLACSVGGFVSLLVCKEVCLAGLCERKILFRLEIYDRLRQATAKRTGYAWCNRESICLLVICS